MAFGGQPIPRGVDVSIHAFHSSSEVLKIKQRTLLEYKKEVPL